MKTYKGLTLSRYSSNGVAGDVPSEGQNKYTGQERGSKGSGNEGRGSQGTREDTAYYKKSLSERKAQWQREKDAGMDVLPFKDWDNTN